MNALDRPTDALSEDSPPEKYGSGGKERRNRSIRTGAVEFHIYLNFRQIVGAAIIGAIIWLRITAPEQEMPNLVPMVTFAAAMIAPELMGEMLTIWKTYRSG